MPVPIPVPVFKEKLGAGNFGVVRKAILRRRGPRPNPNSDRNPNPDFCNTAVHTVPIMSPGYDKTPNRNPSPNPNPAPLGPEVKVRATDENRDRVTMRA